jgi:hypothetical protein
MPIGQIPQQTNLSAEFARNKLLRVKSLVSASAKILAKGEEPEKCSQS